MFLLIANSDKVNMTEMEDDRRFHKLTQEQVETLDQVLTEVIPIHGRGNFPTLEINPKDIIHVVRDRLILKNIKVKDVRLNGSTASHVLVKENNTSYKDLDIIFGVELSKQEDFQIIKEVVLGCLLDFLPKGVNKDKITALTMKEAYVQKMVKVFTEQDRWSLISLSNNSGKNVELKFVNSLRRQFEFSVDSFQIILDTMLQSYLEAEKKLGVQSALTKCPSLNSGTMGHNNNNDINMSCETDSIQSLNDSDSYSKVNISQKEQSTCLEKETTLKTVNKVVNTEINVPVERALEHPFVVEDKNDLKNASLFTDTLPEENTNVTGIDLGNDKKLFVVKNEGTSIKEITSQNKTHISTTDTNKTEGSVKTQPWLELVQKDFSCLSTTGSNGDRCTFQPASITFLTQTALESYAEYPLTPPAKKNNRSSQMVVLKHSSPKPPRKMSKKTTHVSCSPERFLSNNSSINSCQVLHPPKAYPKESLPMQVKLSGLTTKNFELSSASEREPESKQLDICTEAFAVATSENYVHSEETSPCTGISTEINLQSQVQSSEPETGKATHVFVLSTMSDLKNLPTDQNMKNQPIAERVQTAPCKELAPLIYVNCQPLPQINDSSSSPTKKENTESYAQADEPISTQHSDKLKDCPFEMINPLTTNNSPYLEMPSYSEDMPSLQVHKYPVPSLPTQETLVQFIPAEESPVLIPHVLEPRVFSPKAQGLTVSSSHSTNPLKLSISSTASLESSEVSETFLEPAVCLDFRDPSKISLKVLPQILEPSAVSSHMLKNSSGPTLLSKSSDPSILDTKDPLLPSKELPCITVMAESMYGDFEQAMDHLRYRLIATRNPEEIRGGGLLKYSNLLVRDFKPASETEIKTLERYMCSRFFIDFPDVNEQQRKIESYLRNHFVGEEKSKYDYLMTLRRVVNESTVCLMGHERRQTLNMITILALRVLGEQNIIPNANNVTCYYQPAPYMADHNLSNYCVANGQSPLIYHPYPLHIHMQTGLV
ncbi:uncharacterized protein tent5d isoform X1 [Misgurnus anguillicaudatus]|uniref:uncharacterized protein tent5d isoform X1 n=2 Tax=Misgurnus anguillicaudatus TaxID=75329 RepID=UPI003CCFB75B